MLSMIWMMFVFAADGSNGSLQGSDSGKGAMGDTGVVLKALPKNPTRLTANGETGGEMDFGASKSPYALPARSAGSPLQIGLSGWGERGFVQLRVLDPGAVSGFQLTFGGAWSTESEKIGNLQVRSEFSEIQGRVGFLVEPWKEPAHASCNLDLGLQLRKFWSRRSSDSNEVATGSTVLGKGPMVTRSSAFGIQPSLGVEVLYWFRPRVLAVQALFRTGPEWLEGESLSGFRLHGWTSVGLVFTP